MSRVFDALQRSGLEKTGVEYPDMVSIATNVFETPQDQAVGEPAKEESELVAPDSVIENSPAEVPMLEVESDASFAFPSVPVSVAASNRLVFYTEPDSLAAEKFRFLGVRLRQMRQNRPLKKVLVTSTIPEEGKSMVSVNLAGVLARRKEKVLLIDGDLRRPVIAEYAGLKRLTGLAEWLKSGSNKPSNIYHLAEPGFWIMPAGDPPENPLELMQSGRLSRLMEQVATFFDWIVVDSPPLLPLADTTVWSRLTDGTLLVTREGTTQKNALKRGLEVLKQTDLLGVVLNGCFHAEHENYYRRYTPPTAR